MHNFVGVICTEFYPNRLVSVKNRVEFEAAVWSMAFTAPRLMAYGLTQQHLLRRVVPRLMYKYLTHGVNSIYTLKWNTLVTEPILRKLRSLGIFWMNSYSEFHEIPASSLGVGTSSQPDGRIWRSWTSYRTPKGLLDKMTSVCISEAFIMIGSHGQKEL